MSRSMIYLASERGKGMAHEIKIGNRLVGDGLAPVLWQNWQCISHNGDLWTLPSGIRCGGHTGVDQVRKRAPRTLHTAPPTRKRRCVETPEGYISYASITVT